VTDLVILAAAIAGLAVGVVVAFRLSVSYPIAGCAIMAGFGVLAFACILYRLINPPGDVEREVGVWLGLIFAAGVTLGGYLGMQEPAWQPDAST
jgi:Na+-transporting NADH:ubiquinone oxidoreductase subunit NqrB